ncbi:MAG: bifunctional phosphoribosylaminoimidazolecarboxamide formyltransferase/IMP cyclohydrolase, partial [Candidatus Krumholzibacteriota bacterium]|nr:bifunctional phosphoribosylaminoimidazolecarboxamide formyltransferase/IMP cyclohydrolase [Candidatus Krumholzibacteriota bacterium]
YTESPEILGGRVKTLHPKIHGGILADRTNADHVRTLDEHGTRPIDFVVVNLYPFAEKYRTGELSTDEMVEFIDIGGITLLRAAAKNYRHVTVVTSPSQYAEVAEQIRDRGATTEELRARFATRAFALTSTYDAAITRFMQEITPGEDLPQFMPLGLSKITDVRYGENPHQRGALYGTGSDSPLLDMEVLQGKELSFNNYLDIIGAFTLARDLGAQAVSIIKHTNPCGAAWCGEVLRSFRRALACDKTSAFGGVVAVNGTIEEDLAGELTSMFLEVVIARRVEDEARSALRKKKNVRVIEIPDRHWDSPTAGGLAVYALGAVLYQDEDSGFPELETMKSVTKKQPSDVELGALKKAWVVAKHVKSNAIVIADDEGTVGIGAGQMSRVDSSQIATRKAFDAGFSVAGKVAASDAFFPFADGVTELAKSGISAVVQPGGSIRDQEVIDAADASSIAMVFTRRRHFRHI